VIGAQGQQGPPGTNGTNGTNGATGPAGLSVIPSGITADLPATTVVGEVYLDTSLGKLVFALTTSPTTVSGWVDATGANPYTS
jgi:hypothetical protein